MIESIRESVSGQSNSSHLNQIPLPAEPHLSRLSQVPKPAEPHLSRLSQPIRLATNHLSQPIPAPSQPNFVPSPYRANMGRLSQPVYPSQQVAGYDDPSMEIAALRQMVTRLEQQVLSLAEKAGNDIRHLSDARISQQEGKSDVWPWVVGIGLGGAVVYWLFFAPSPAPVTPGDRMGHSQSRSAGVPRVMDRIGNKVVDNILGKALKLVL